MSQYPPFWKKQKQFLRYLIAGLIIIIGLFVYTKSKMKTSSNGNTQQQTQTPPPADSGISTQPAPVDAVNNPSANATGSGNPGTGEVIAPPGNSMPESGSSPASPPQDQ